MPERITLTLDRLRKGAAFRVVADFDGADVRLVTSDLYRMASAMADSGKTCVVENVGRSIRIPREQARRIEVFMVRREP